MKKKNSVEVKNINVFQKEVKNITTFSKLDYCLIYASNIFLYDDVIEITIK